MWPNPQETAGLVTFTKDILKETFVKKFVTNVWQGSKHASVDYWHFKDVLSGLVIYLSYCYYIFV